MPYSIRPITAKDTYDPDQIVELELGCEVKGLGRGHIKRIKDEVRQRFEK